MKKIGVYSGTFDPVHNGHIAFAMEAIEQCSLHKVFFLVEPEPRRKQGVKALEHRVRMVQLAIAKHRKLGIIVLEQQQFTPKATLPVLMKRFEDAELYMLLGDDMLAHITDWPNVKYLFQHIGFIVGARKTSTQTVQKIMDHIASVRSMKFRYEIINVPETNVSSFAVRARLRKGLTSKDVDPAVGRYIKQQQLYAPAGADDSDSSL